MVNNTDIICVIYYTDNRYTKLAKVAHDSFVKFHKDEVATFVMTPENYSEYTCSKITTAPGIMKYMLAHEIAKKHDSKKIIILGGFKMKIEYMFFLFAFRTYFICTKIFYLSRIITIRIFSNGVSLFPYIIVKRSVVSHEAIFTAMYLLFVKISLPSLYFSLF